MIAKEKIMNVGTLKKILENYDDDVEIFKDICDPDLSTNKWDFIVKPVVCATKGRVAKYNGKDYATAQRPCKKTKDAKLCLIV